MSGAHRARDIFFPANKEGGRAANKEREINRGRTSPRKRPWQSKHTALEQLWLIQFFSFFLSLSLSLPRDSARSRNLLRGIVFAALITIAIIARRIIYCVSFPRPVPVPCLGSARLTSAVLKTNCPAIR